MLSDQTEHWQDVYISKAESELSWFEARPDLSLEMIAALHLKPGAKLVDIGAGASRLVDGLIEAGWQNVAVLDLAAEALETAKRRLGPAGKSVCWIASDVRRWKPEAATFDVWHDRAAFHFLTDAKDRAAYCATLNRALKPGGHALIAGFAPDGPERCSGMPVIRYDAADIVQMLGPDFSLQASYHHTHQTPWHSEQRFQYNLFTKRGA